MKINLCSDLHLEFSDLVLPGGDILIVAGDLCEAKNLHRDQFYRFIQEECSSKYKETIMVMGNHEHYGYQFEKTADHIRSHLPDNVYLLEKDTHVINDVLFVGGTMWTDINRNDPATHSVLRYSMNDYRYIKQFDSANNAYYKLTTQRTMQEHADTVAYFKQVLDDNRTGPQLPVVVVSHHSPSTLSTKPRYEHDREMNGGYSSDLSEFILDYPEIAVWVHGHTHDRFNYQIGSTRILCNPRGYLGHESCASEFKTRWFDVDSKQGLVAVDEW
jgi:3',5'-cyclic AMP phosphodiesterase CpdA